MTDDDDRREDPLLTYDQAEAEAIEEAMPMLRFIRDAKQKFGPVIGEKVKEAFADDIWDIASEAADRINPDDISPISEIYSAIFAAKIKEETK